MIKLNLILGLIFLVNLCSGQNFRPQELKDDLDFLVQTYESVHPNLYAYYSKNDFYNEISGVKEQIKSPMSDLDFWLLLAPIVNKLSDGHTRLPLGDNFDTKDLNKIVKKYIPITVYVLDTAIYLDKQLDKGNSETPRGSKIISINGVSSKNIIQTLIDYVPGELIDYRKYYVQSYFTRLFSIHYPANQFKIKYQREGEIKHVTLRGINSYVTNKERAKTNYEFTVINKNLGKLEYNWCRNIDRFDIFCDSIFRILNERKIDNFVIDIRKNQGGNSGLNDILFSHLYDKPFDSFQKIDVKVSKEIRDKYGYYRKNFNRDTTYTRTTDLKSIPSKLKYNGRIFVLTSIRTFSSGTDCAQLFKDYNVGTIIGQETGGLPTSYGDTYKFELPNTKLIAKSSYKYFIRPSGIDDGRGVLPDIEIKYSIDDLILEKDLEMEYVINAVE